MNQLPWFPIPRTVYSTRQVVEQKLKRDTKGKVMRQVLAYVQDHPCQSTHQLAIGMGKTDVWTSSHLQNLEWKGLVTYELKKSPKRDSLIKFWSAV